MGKVYLDDICAHIHAHTCTHTQTKLNEQILTSYLCVILGLFLMFQWAKPAMGATVGGCPSLPSILSVIYMFVYRGEQEGVGEKIISPWGSMKCHYLLFHHNRLYASPHGIVILAVFLYSFSLLIAIVWHAPLSDRRLILIAAFSQLPCDAFVMHSDTSKMPSAVSE